MNKALRIFGLQAIKSAGSASRSLLAAFLLLFFAAPSFGQLILQLDLQNLGAVPYTSRQVAWQQLSPFPGNVNIATSDPSTGILFITNPPVGPSLAVLYPIAITIQAPPGQKIQLQVTMLPGDSGTIDASNRLSSPSPTFPAGLVSWAIITAETRYALSGGATNQYATFTTVTNVNTQFFQVGSNFTLTIGQNISNTIASLGSGNGNYKTNGTLFAGDTYLTNGSTLHGNVGAATNIPAFQQGYTLTTNLAASSGHTNIPTFNSSGSEVFWDFLALPYDAVGIGTNYANLVGNNDTNNTYLLGQQTTNNFVFNKGGSATNLNIAGNATLGAWNITTNVGSGALVFSNAPSTIAATNHTLVISNIVSQGVITNGTAVWVNGVGFSGSQIEGLPGFNNLIYMSQLSPPNTIQFTSGGLFSGIVYSPQYEGGNGTPVLGAIYWADSIHWANWLICTNPSNGYLLITNSPSVIAATNQTLVVSNLISLGQISGNLIGILTNSTIGNSSGATNYLGTIDGTGIPVYSQNSIQTNAVLTNSTLQGTYSGSGGIITNLTVQTLTVTNGQIIGGWLFQQSLSVLSVTNSTAEGTYLWYPTPAAYSNVNNQAWVILSNTTCTFQSNGMSYYANSSILGQYSAVGGSSAPFPLVNEGGFFWHQGWLTQGPVLPGGDTNTWYWITNEAGTFALFAYQAGSNYTTSVSNSLYTIITITSNGIVAQIGGGGGAANAYYTNNPNALSSLSAINANLGFSNATISTLTSGFGNANNTTNWNTSIGYGNQYLQNSLHASASNSIVIGGSNVITTVSGTGFASESLFDSILEGFNNTNEGANYSSIVNGQYNTLLSFPFEAIVNGQYNNAHGRYVFIGNGYANVIGSYSGNGSDYGFIGNGATNYIAYNNNASFPYGYNLIGNGTFNTITNAFYASILNGNGNFINPNGGQPANDSILNGNSNNISALGSTVIGSQITVNQNDVFAANDNSGAIVTQTNNAAYFNFGGGVNINSTNISTNTLQVGGNTLIAGNLGATGTLYDNGTNTTVTSATAGTAPAINIGNGGNGAGVSVTGGQGANIGIGNGGTVNNTALGISQGGNAGTINIGNGGSVTNHNSGYGGNGGTINIGLAGTGTTGIYTNGAMGTVNLGNVNFEASIGAFPSLGTNSAFSGGIEWVSTNGTASGQRNNPQSPFALPSQAAAVMQQGDTMIVFGSGGTSSYFEGSNTMGQLPKNVSIIGIGKPLIIYTNYASSISASSIYIQPNDNDTIRNLWFETTVSNHFSAVFGNNGNVAGTATNWHVNINSFNCDSDFIYLGGTNLMNHCSFDNVIDHHYWDGFALASTVNTNDIISLNNCEFNCDYQNGLNPSARSGLNIQSGGGAFYLNNVLINMPNTNGLVPSIGVRIGPNCQVFLNTVGFNDLPSTKATGTPTFADIYYGSQYAGGGSIGFVYSLTTNALVIQNAFPQNAFPNNLAGSTLYGTVSVPMSISQDLVDGLNQVYGQWNFYDFGTNGTMILTNQYNQAAANGGSSILFQPDDLNAGAPVAGQMILRDMSYVGNGNGLTNLAGISGFVETNIIGATAGIRGFSYTVPAGVTNSYAITGYLTVTALSLDVIQPKIVWTDETGTVQTISLGSSISSTGYNNLPYTFIRAKGGTTIFETNALTTGTGSITYNTEVHLNGISNNQ